MDQARDELNLQGLFDEDLIIVALFFCKLKLI